jgi:hypothetical protein
MYPSSGATIRADLNIKVEEAAGADQMFIGRLVMPPMSVDAKSGTYPKIDIAGGELLTPGATVRMRGGSYGKIARKWGTDTYDCLDRGLEEPVDDTDVKDVGRFFNLEAAAARWTLRNVLLDHETRVQAAIMNTTNFGSATTSTVAYTAANLATIDFAADLLAAIERVQDQAQLANTIVMSSKVFVRLKQTTKLQNWIRGTIVGAKDTPITSSTIAASFADHGITQCLVGRARYNSAKKGQAKSIAQVWPTTYIWVGYVNPGASTPQDGGAGWTFYWNQEGGFYVTETYRNEELRSNMARVRQNTAEKVSDGTAGTLIDPQYS